MNEPLQVKVERGRSSCPYCKGEVTGGHVWLCPGCAAPHHPECMNDHGACATCGHRAATVTKPAGDATFARFRAAIASLGFAILREDEREVLALHTAWQGQAHLVHLVHVDTLTRDQVETDLARLFRDPLAQGNASLLHLARSAEPDALELLRSPDTALSRNAFACVPMAATPDGLTTPRGWLGESFPVHGELAFRIVEKASSLAPRPPGPPPPPAPPPVVYARPAPPPGLLRPPREPTTPAAPGEQASAREVLLAIVAALVVGVALLVALAALT